MKINPRGAPKSPLWRRRPAVSRALLAAAMGCFYLAFTGDPRIVEDDAKLGNLLNIGTSTEPQQQTSKISFPGYPLTRQSMLDVGAQMGRSAVPKASKQPGVWCRQRPTSTANFLTPTLNTTTKGLFFVKTPKTASQSINRILRRATLKLGTRRQNEPCFMRGHHIKGDAAGWYGQRDATKSVLMTSLRDPATRALSRIYWTLSTRQHGKPITLDPIKRFLKSWTDVETGCISKGQGGFQLSYVSLPTINEDSAWRKEEPEVVQNPEKIHALVQQVIQDYDFILVQDRLEESLVAMQLLLGLETADILSMPLHVGGSYLYDRHAGCLELFSPPALPHQGKAASTTTSTMTPTEVVQYLDHYLQSPTWYAQNYGDYVLWGAARAGLEATIRDLGSRFDMALQQFRDMQQHVLEVCSQKVVFPCSVNGTIQREDYQIGNPKGAGDRYPQEDIEDCIDLVVRDQAKP